MKILIVRFSSIGDIVLTTPVIRCLKTQTGCELHYLTFRRFSEVLEHNPYIDQLITIERSIREVIPQLKNIRYDLIVDLHRNIRTLGLRIGLRRPFVTFRKLNFRKYLLVNLRIDVMPDIHIVNRYMAAVKRLGVAYDGAGLDYFTGLKDCDIAEKLPENFRDGYIAIVIGGRYTTKIYPPELLSKVISMLNQQVVLMGGAEDRERGEAVKSETSSEIVFNACGLFSINESSALISNAGLVITNDTGLMHIAAAFRKPVISIWGNTVPSLGMYPFMPEDIAHYSIIVEMDDVPCRPCSKLGFAKCPRKHFDCMLKIDPKIVAQYASELHILND